MSEHSVVALTLKQYFLNLDLTIATPSVRNQMSKLEVDIRRYAYALFVHTDRWRTQGRVTGKCFDTDARPNQSTDLENAATFCLLVRRTTKTKQCPFHETKKIKQDILDARDPIKHLPEAHEFLCAANNKQQTILIKYHEFWTLLVS